MRLQSALLLSCIFLFLNISISCYADNDVKPIETGAVIIDGKYIEPPYLIEVRRSDPSKFEIWINNEIAENFSSAKSVNDDNKINPIKFEMCAKYFEIANQIGWSDAKDDFIKVLKTSNIQGFDLGKSEFNQTNTGEKDMLEISISENLPKIEFDTNPTPRKQRTYLECYIIKRYRAYLAATKSEKTNLYDSLISTLDEQKKKGNIKDYKIEKSSNIASEEVLNRLTPNFRNATKTNITDDFSLLIEYTANAGWYCISPSIGKELIVLSEEDVIAKDNKQIHLELDSIVKSLMNKRLLIFSNNNLSMSAPEGDSLILQIKSILKDKTVSREMMSRRLKKIGSLNLLDEEFFQEIIENFHK